MLSATVVVLVENDEVTTGQVALDESGCPDCATPVYDTHLDITFPAEFSVTTTLFAPVDGQMSCHNLSLLQFVFVSTLCTSVIPTPLYVTVFTTGAPLLAVAT